MKGKSLWERIRSVSYMQASLALFAAALVLIVYLFIRAVLSGGTLGRSSALLGGLGLIMALAGFLLPLYGKYVVRGKDRPDYRLGLLLNGPLFLLYVFFYFLGV